MNNRSINLGEGKGVTIMQLKHEQSVCDYDCQYIHRADDDTHWFLLTNIKGSLTCVGYLIEHIATELVKSHLPSRIDPDKVIFIEHYPISDFNKSISAFEFSRQHMSPILMSPIWPLHYFGVRDKLVGFNDDVRSVVFNPEVIKVTLRDIGFTVKE